MKYIDISFWWAEEMPIVIEGRVGYTTETYPIKGGTRTYHYLRAFGIGAEIAVTKRRRGERINGERNAEAGSLVAGVGDSS